MPQGAHSLRPTAPTRPGAAHLLLTSEARLPMAALLCLMALALTLQVAGEPSAGGCAAAAPAPFGPCRPPCNAAPAGCVNAFALRRHASDLLQPCAEAPAQHYLDRATPPRHCLQPRTLPAAWIQTTWPLGARPAPASWDAANALPETALRECRGARSQAAGCTPILCPPGAVRAPHPSPHVLPAFSAESQGCAC